MEPESFFTSFFDNDDDKKANVYLKIASTVII